MSSAIYQFYASADKEYAAGEFILVETEIARVRFNHELEQWYWEITRTDIKTGENVIEIIPSNEDGTAIGTT